MISPQLSSALASLISLYECFLPPCGREQAEAVYMHIIYSLMMKGK